MLAENFRLWRKRVFKEGQELGLEQGLSSGIEKGIEKGIARGKQATAREIAGRLLARGMAPDKVATIAGMRVAELEGLLQH